MARIKLREARTSSLRGPEGGYQAPGGRVSKVTEAIGFTGVVLVLVAYTLMVWGVLSPASVTTILMNLTGALFLSVPVVVKKVWSLVTLNVIWALIALAALVRLFF